MAELSIYTAIFSCFYSIHPSPPLHLSLMRIKSLDANLCAPSVNNNLTFLPYNHPTAALAPPQNNCVKIVTRTWEGMKGIEMPEELLKASLEVDIK